MHIPLIFQISHTSLTLLLIVLSDTETVSGIETLNCLFCASRMVTSSGGCLSAISEALPSSIYDFQMKWSTWSRRRWWPGEGVEGRAGVEADPAGVEEDQAEVRLSFGLIFWLLCFKISLKNLRAKVSWPVNLVCVCPLAGRRCTVGSLVAPRGVYYLVNNDQIPCTLPWIICFGKIVKIGLSLVRIDDLRVASPKL